MMTEHRTAPRHRTLKAGLIVFNDGRSTISCIVRNMSDSGALLKVQISAGIPDSFTLRFDQKSVGCVVVRRTLTELGVRFADDDLSPRQAFSTSKSP